MLAMLAAQAHAVLWEDDCAASAQEGLPTFLKQDAEYAADLLVSRRRHRLRSLTRLCLCKPDSW